MKFSMTGQEKGDLLDPNFVSAYEVKDYIYFFFREIAVEYINCGKVSVITCTVKRAHMVTSVMQSPVLKGHLFLVLS
jgi:hypothetical protein